MTKHYEAHAEKVVESFKTLLSSEAIDAVGEEQFSELSMLIESAISTSVVKELEGAADAVNELGQRLRKHAESYDD